MLKALSKRKIFTLFAILALLALVVSTVVLAGAEESTENKEIEVYLIAGQSNAVGYGENLTATDERFTKGFDNVLYYGEGEHWDGDDNKPPLEFVPVTVGLGQNSGYNPKNTPARSGAEIGIASALGDSNKMNAVIKCAWGGTSIYNGSDDKALNYGTWTSPTYIKDNNISTDGNKWGRMYIWFLETVAHGLEMLEADGYTPVIKGIWWMQGEAETGSDKTSSKYNELLTDLINDMREDLTKITGVNQRTTPFVMGEITSNHAAMGKTTPSHLGVVCQAQLDVAAALNNVFVVDTTGLAQQDDWHYTADAQKTIGERFVATVTEANANAAGDIYTKYGVIPKENAYAEDGVTKIPLAVFQNGNFLGSYSDWNTALSDINKNNLIGKSKDAAKVEIVLIDDFTATKFDNTSHLGGTLVIDLNGHTLTTGSDHLLNGIAKSYATNKMCDTNIIFENGNVQLQKGSISSFGVWSDKYPSEKAFNYTFNNVNFGFKKTDATYLIAVYANNSLDNNPDLKLYVNMEFNNCEFDLQTNANDTDDKLFYFKESVGKAQIYHNVTINGGKIIKSTCSNGSLWYIDTEKDKVSFGKYNGHYTTLELPGETTPGTEKFTATDKNVISLQFAKIGSEKQTAEDGTVSTAKTFYELTNLETKYGTIPSSLSSIEDYPFILFKIKGDGKLEKAEGFSMPIGLNSTDTFGAIHTAKAYLQNNEWDAESGYEGQKSAVIFQRRDYTYAKNEHYANYAQARGIITFDLNGYKLSQSKESGAQPIFRIASKAWNTSSWISGDHAPIFPTTINVVNGSIETFSSPVMLLQMSPCNDTGYYIKDKIFTINYDNISFTLAEGATTTSLIAGYYNPGSVSTNDPTPVAPFFTNLNDCTIDLTKNVPQKDFLLFNIAPSDSKDWERYLSNTVTMNGGVIKSKYWDNYIVVSNTGKYGSTFKFGKSATTGSYTELELPNTEAYPSYLNVLDGKDGKLLTFTLVKTKTEQLVKTYILGESVLDKYGYIPHRYSNASDYPYITIVYDKNGNIIQIEGFKSLLNNTGAFHCAKEGIKNNAWNSESGYEGQMTAVILARRDYVIGASESYANFAQIKGVVTLDLNGYTLSQATTANAKPLFYVTSKPWGDVFPSTIDIKNGKIFTYNGAIFNLNMWTSTSSEGMDEKLFTFNLNNLTLGLCEGATATDFLVSYGSSTIDPVWVGKEKIAPYFFNLTDCVIDLETVKPASSINIFNISTDVADGNYMSNTVNVYGCEFKTDTLDNINFVTDGGNGSSLTFNKLDGGNYMLLTLAKDADAPTAQFNNGALVFVKVSETADEVLYRLRPAALAAVDFTPKSSITLSNALIYNVYVPVSTALKSFTLDETKYADLSTIISKITTLSDGKQYYHFEIELPSPEAARDIVLTATLTVGEEDFSGSFTMSIPKYAKKVIEQSTKDYERQLAKDVLAYVAAAYEYFTGENDEAEITRVVNLIYEILVIGGPYEGNPETVGVTKINDGSVVTDVTLNPDAKPTIRFYVTDKNVKFSIDGNEIKTLSGEDNGKLYVELEVYAYMLCQTITFGDGESYHISDFLTKSAGAEYENLVACFIVYTESAAAYRKAVIEA